MQYSVQTGRDRDWLYVVHINKGGESKGKNDWKAAGPTIPHLDRALQGYSYDIREINSDSAAAALVQFVKLDDIDVLIVSMGRPKGTMGRLNPIQSRTTDYIASHSPCATLVIHPQARSPSFHPLCILCRKYFPPMSIMKHMRDTLIPGPVYSDSRFGWYPKTSGAPSLVQKVEAP